MSCQTHHRRSLTLVGTTADIRVKKVMARSVNSYIVTLKWCLVSLNQICLGNYQWIVPHLQIGGWLVVWGGRLSENVFSAHQPNWAGKMRTGKHNFIWTNYVKKSERIRANKWRSPVIPSDFTRQLVSAPCQRKSYKCFFLPYLQHPSISSHLSFVCSYTASDQLVSNSHP